MFYSIVNQTETNCIVTFLYILNIDVGKVTTGNMTGYIVDCGNFGAFLKLFSTVMSKLYIYIYFLNCGKDHVTYCVKRTV